MLKTTQKQLRETLMNRPIAVHTGPKEYVYNQFKPLKRGHIGQTPNPAPTLCALESPRCKCASKEVQALRFTEVRSRFSFLNRKSAKWMKQSGSEPLKT